MKQLWTVPLALGMAVCALPSHAQSVWQENEVPLPGPLQRSALIPFDMSTRTELQFSVDASSISVGSDRVLRYVLVARSNSGAENILYEGLRCETGEARNYARWNPSEQRWVPYSGTTPWRPLSGVAASLPAARLAYLAFCEGRTPTEPMERLLADLRRGGKNVGLR
ncbi:CNP1-like family protein [Hydrogenophaga atypica]|uniref:CNP1-like family protein n=1 Tax=Hydrogenophaga atypica TaxID=249409 RepID=A0ABW2QHM7_9BURK